MQSTSLVVLIFRRGESLISINLLLIFSINRAIVLSIKFQGIAKNADYKNYEVFKCLQKCITQKITIIHDKDELQIHTSEELQPAKVWLICWEKAKDFSG